MPRHRPAGVLTAILTLAGMYTAWLLCRSAIDEWRTEQLLEDWHPSTGVDPVASPSAVKRWLIEHTQFFDGTVLTLALLAVGRELALACGYVPRRKRGGSRSTKGEGGEWNIDEPLFHFSTGDPWTPRHAFEGFLGVGSTGAGKSSGSARCLALSMLRAGWGGLVLTAKSEERRVWKQYCRETGRSEDLIVFGSDSPWRFNAVNHELLRAGSGAGLTENVLHLLMTILEASDAHSPDGGQREGEAYWRKAMLQLLRNSIDLLSTARGEMSVHDLYRIVISAPQSTAEFTSKEWQASSFCFASLKEADARPKSPRQALDFEMVADYFCKEFPALSEKTRSIIVSSFTSLVDVLNRGILRELLCTTTNIAPQDAERGSILLIDLPVKEFGIVGSIAQVIWKYSFQRSIERRNVRKSPRPVFLFADEAQNFLTSYDMQFLTTCRAARVASVLLTQNVANVYAALGGNEKGRVEGASIFGNLGTKIFHANSEAQTNEFAATLIGRSRVLLSSGNHSRAEEDVFASMTGIRPLGQMSTGYSETFEFEVQPSEFARLRTGGPANGGVIDAIVFQSGRRFGQSNRNWAKVTFQQAK